jgi:hypothetical protein
MFGRWITGLIVVGLAVGVWALWPRDDTVATTTTVAEASPTTTTSNPTTTSDATTTSSGTVGDPESIETVEEAEEILRELWFGWFEGIYNQDEDRIKEVVASQSQLDAAIAAFGTMTFDAVPTIEGVHLTEIELLHADLQCTVIWAHLTVDFRVGESESVHVFRITDDGWKTVSSWVNKSDLWESDCDAQLEPLL